MKKFEMLDEMLQYFEPTYLLEEVIRALSDDEAMDVFNFIATMHDINFD